MDELGLLRKSIEYIIKCEERKREIENIIILLDETKKKLSLNILNSHDADTYIQAISEISLVIKRLSKLKEKL